VTKRLLGLLLALSLLTACAGSATTPTPIPATSAPTAAATATTAAPVPPTPSAAAAASVAPASATATTGVPRTPANTATRATTPPGSPAARATVTSAARPANTGGNTPNTTPAAGAALIDQAVGILLDSYVDQLQSSDLFQAAYTGAVATLRASGKTPQPQPPALTGDRKADSAAFKTAYLALAGNAGGDINQTILAYEAIRAIAEQVNECHTAFLDPEQYRSVTAGLSGTNTYGGIGVTIRTQTRPVTIGDIFPDTPAAQSGLRPGDAILKVDNTDVSDLSADAISPLVRGTAGTQVTLTVQRPGETATRSFTITRAEITVPVFTTDELAGPNGTKVGYMKLYSFSTGTDLQIQKALEKFEQDGMTGWVLDLRDNGGGYIDTLSKIASRFLKNGEPVAYRIERGGAEEPIGTDPSLYYTPQHPFAILINGGSASASEALSSAAADYGFARLFGQKTAGCLAGATNYRLADGSALQVTIWKIVSPQHREINRSGQPPAQEIQPDPTGATDPVLDAAKQWLAAQQGR
jgi:carboxyl-terminal processing protease